MTARRKTALLRGIRAVAAVAVASVVAYLSGPHGTELVSASQAHLIQACVIPVLLAVDKFLRYGSDEGEE